MAPPDPASQRVALGLLETVEVETAPAPRASVIWLHGLGADGHDFEPIVPELGLPKTLPLRFVFPHAPLMPITINGRVTMRAWYDVHDDRGHRREDEAGVRASQQRIEALMARERARGIASHRLVLAGFSQGGALALHTGLRYRERLGGILALSCFLPLSDKLAAESSLTNRYVPIFMAHGTHDGVIPIARAQRSRDFLIDRGYRVNWRAYAMAHGVIPEQIKDIALWLVEVLAGA